MDRPTLSTHLQGLGLSRTEALTYLHALERDGAPTKTIAEEIDRPESDVESAIRRLDTRGFVTTDGETIDARPLETVLENVHASLDALEAFASSGSETGTGADLEAETDTAHRLPFEVVDTRETILERLVELVDDATEEVALSIPASVLEELEGELRNAVDRGVLVGLLVCGDESVTTDRFDGLASVARVWSRAGTVLAVADYDRGVSAPADLLVEDGASTTEPGIAFDHRQQSFVLMGSFFGNYWRIATQLYATEPDPLPRTYTNIRHAVFQATLRLDRGDDVHISANARPVGVEEYDTVEGRLVDVRQSLLEPVNESFAIENGLIVDRTDDGVDGERVTLGGEGAFVEEFKTRSVTLSSLE